MKPYSCCRHLTFTCTEEFWNAFEIMHSHKDEARMKPLTDVYANFKLTLTRHKSAVLKIEILYTLDIQKYIALFQNRNEVPPLHKHHNSASGKNLITNVRYCGLKHVWAFPFCLPSSMGRPPAHTHSTTHR